MQTIRNALSQIMPPDTSKASVRSLSNNLRTFRNTSMKLRRLWGTKKKEVFLCMYGFSTKAKRDLIVFVLEYTTLSRCVHASTTLVSRDAGAGGWEMLVSIIADCEDEYEHNAAARLQNLEALCELLGTSAGIISFDEYLDAPMRSFLQRLQSSADASGVRSTPLTITGNHIYADLRERMRLEAEDSARATLEQGTGFRFTPTQMLRYVNLSSAHIARLEQSIRDFGIDVQSVVATLEEGHRAVTELREATNEIRNAAWSPEPVTTTVHPETSTPAVFQDTSTVSHYNPNYNPNTSRELSARTHSLAIQGHRSIARAFATSRNMEIILFNLSESLSHNNLIPVPRRPRTTRNLPH